jgi:hypothetical protein
MRLIDADALDKVMGEAYLSLFNEYGSFDAYAMGYESAACAVEAAPTIDAVLVVRCKDCDWYREEDGGICVNPKCTKSYYGCRVPEQHFCSYGEWWESE